METMETIKVKAKIETIYVVKTEFCCTCGTVVENEDEAIDEEFLDTLILTETECNNCNQRYEFDVDESDNVFVKKVAKKK